jgi:hypothetical protein
MTKENSFTLFKTPAWNISVFSVGSFMTMGLQLTTFYRFTYYHALDDLSLQPNMISHIASPGLPSSLIIAQNFSVPMFVLGTIRGLFTGKIDILTGAIVLQSVCYISEKAIHGITGT